MTEQNNQIPKENNKYEKIRCPHCNSGFNYFKIKEQIWQCRNCGKKFKKEKQE